MRGESEHGADPWHRGQARVTPCEIGLGGDRLGEALLEGGSVSIRAKRRLARRRSMASFELCGLVFDCDVLVTELASHGDDLGDSGGGRVMAHDVRGHGRDILGDQPGIEPIVLGEGAAGAGELPKSAGAKEKARMDMLASGDPRSSAKHAFRLSQSRIA